MTKSRKIGFASFFLPIGLFLVILAILGQYPFGDDTMLILDMDSQFNAFFVHFRDMLRGDASFFYSFTRAFGGDMLSVSAYYLISPFNLLFLFFDAEHIYAGIILVMTLKVGAMGWAMNRYLVTRQNEWTTLLFSSGYALCAYFVAYGSNMMWLDGMMTLPFLVLGIERLVDEGKYRLYLFSIAYAVLTSFYIGYMLCVFSVLYFLGYFILLSKRARSVKTVLTYAGSSLLGGMISGILSIPTVYAMQDGKQSFSLSSILNWTKTVDTIRLIANSFVGVTDDTQLVTGAPLIYCGVLAFVLAIFFFFDKTVPVRRKCFYGVLMLFLLFSMSYMATCYLWQGFNIPNGAHFRFSFLYVFLVLVIANDACVSFDENDKRRIVLPVTGVCLLVFLLSLRAFMKGQNHGLMWEYNVALVLFYVAALFVIKNKTLRNGLLLASVSAELVVGAVSHYSSAPLYQANTSVPEFQEYVQTAGELVDEVKEDDGFYRTVLAGDAYRTPSDNFLFNLYGLDSYTSLEQNKTLDLALQFGYYRHIIFGIHYREGSTRAAESLLGVKYLITSDEPMSGYTKLDENESFALYENNTAMPFAMLADESILSVNNDVYNTFRFQNEILQSLCALDTPVYTRAELSFLQDMSYNCKQNADGTIVLLDPAQDGIVTCRLSAEKAAAYYMHSNTADVTDLTVTVNGEELTFGESVVKRLGYLGADDEVILQCRISGEGAHDLSNIFVYREDEEMLQAYADAVNAKGVDVQKEKDDHITVHLTNEEETTQYVLFTMAYDEGWHITVDGEEVSLYQVVNDLTAIAVEPGEHTIELRYLSRGFKKGVAVTAAALLIVLGLFIAERKRTDNRMME